MDLSFLVGDDAGLRRILLATRAIALVGASNDPTRASHGVGAYLQRQGFLLRPVNPRETMVLGEPCVATVDQAERPIDLVDVFRRASDVAPHVEEAIRAGAKVLWLQLGVIAPEAARRAHEAGMEVVMDRCTLQEHRRLIGAAR